MSVVASSMASLLSSLPSITLQNKVQVNPTRLSLNPLRQISSRKHMLCLATKVEGDLAEKKPLYKHDYGVVSVHHVGILCENLEKSLEFYQNILGLEINEARPNEKLPYRGAWLWVGSEMIHLMELQNPDPLTGRPEHGGRDRHTCIAIKDVSKLKAIFDEAAQSNLG